MKPETCRKVVRNGVRTPKSCELNRIKWRRTVLEREIRNQVVTTSAKAKIKWHAYPLLCSCRSTSLPLPVTVFPTDLSRIDGVIELAVAIFICRRARSRHRSVQNPLVYAHHVAPFTIWPKGVREPSLKPEKCLAL